MPMYDIIYKYKTNEFEYQRILYIYIEVNNLHDTLRV